MNGMLEETKEYAQVTGSAPKAPELEYTQIPDSEAVLPATDEPITGTAASGLNEMQVYALPKKRRKGVIALATLIFLAGVGTVVYRFDILSETTVFKGLNVENMTELPEGAKPPAFSPLNPAEFANDVDVELIAVPDETWLDPSPENKNNGAAIPSKNYYTRTPNVSEFYTRAAQDESYVYFLKYESPENGHMLYNLMATSKYPATGQRLHKKSSLKPQPCKKPEYS